MKTYLLRPHLLCGIIGLVIFSACSQSQPPQPLEVGSDPDLAAHSAEFKQAVIKVTDGVYVAVGFGLANSILLEGRDGVVILDAMESAEAAAPVKAAFNKITAKPVRAIIYTHYHSDHTQGAAVMAGNDTPEVYSHESTLYYLKRIASITRETTYRRAIFDGYLGWFGGNATDLFPLSPDERAKRFVELAGSEQKLIEHAKQAVAKKNYQWALELSDQLLRINPDSDVVRELKAEALSSLRTDRIA